MTPPVDRGPDIGEFESHRRHLRALAYRMLGSRAEAEDVVQDCWLRWRAATGTGISEAADTKISAMETRAAETRETGDAIRVIEQPRAWLSRVATHLCLDRLQSARARREQYVGVWLPDPLLDEDMQAYDAGPEVQVDHAQQVSIAFMLALERLSPLERAAFLLHDVFDIGFDEIGARLRRSPAACRQLASRARTHVQAGQARVDVQQEVAQQLLAAFAGAVSAGDVEGLAALLADEVQFLSDGGGKANAVPKPLIGAARVAKAFIGFAKLWDPLRHPARPARINGLPGVVLAEPDGQVLETIALQLGRRADGQARVDAIYVTRNPDKLPRLVLIG